MMTRKQCLDILDLPAGASRDEIVKAYRHLAQVWHPDRFTNNQELQQKAHVKLANINEAYSTLIEGKATPDSNPESGRNGHSNAAPNSAANAPPPPRQPAPPPQPPLKPTASPPSKAVAQSLLDKWVKQVSLFTGIAILLAAPVIGIMYLPGSQQVERAMLGVTLFEDSITQQLGIQQGVLVRDVNPNGGAAKAGVLPTLEDADGNIHMGDVIVEVGGRPIHTTLDLLKALNGRKPGETIRVALDRNGKSVAVTVPLQAVGNQ